MDNRRLFIAVLLSLAVLLVWQYFVPTQPPKKPGPRPGTTSPETPKSSEPAGGGPSAGAPGTAEAATLPAGQPVQGSREERIVLESAWARAVFSSRGAQLVSYQLKQHTGADGKPLEMVRARREGPYPFGLVERGGGGHPLNAVLFASQAGRPGDAVFLYRGPAGSAEKRFRFNAQGLLEAEVRAPGQRGWSVLLGPGARDFTPAELESRYLHRSGVADAGGKIEVFDPQEAEGPIALPAESLRWAGLQDNYYLTAAIPGEGLARAVLEPLLVEPGPAGAGSTFRPLPPPARITEDEKKLKLEFRLLLEPSGDRLVLSAVLGAKEYDRLAALPYGLERAVDLGFFAFLARPLLAGLHWIHDNVVANYGWAIILMTVLIKILLLPLTHKSYVSMQKMQQLNPKMQAIRDRYKGKMRDKQGKPNVEAQRKMNEEIMGLYKAEGVNPAGGCLPMLLQLPILFAFFNLLTAAVELRNASWILWIRDLSQFDPFYVLPLVMTFTQFIQTRMTPMTGDPMQRRMFQLMPLFMLFFFVWSPSGLVLYWLTNNILTIIQQGVYNHLKQRRAAA